MYGDLMDFIIPYVGSKHEVVSKFKTSSPWKNEEVSFNAQNLPYPTLHTHEYYEILVILSGRIAHTINGRSYVMQEGDCCFIRPEDCHRLTFQGGEMTENKIFSINFMLTKDFYRNSVSCYGSDPFPSVEQDDAPLTFHISNTVRENIQRTCLHIQAPLNQPTPSNVLICKALVSELLHIAVLSYSTRDHIRSPAWLQELMTQMQKNESISKKTEDLLSDTPYSRSYVEKLFRRHFGVSIVEYRNSVKMARAKELLSSTTLSVSQIAEMLGFESVPYFSILFKRSFGFSPIQHRKKNSMPFVEDI